MKSMDASTSRAAGRPVAARPARVARAAAAAPSTAEMIRTIRARLGESDPRRIGTHHADVLHALMEAGEPALDVHGIYKALMDRGAAMIMTRVCRALKLLEEARLIERRPVLHGSRQGRALYRVAGHVATAPVTAGEVCVHCGAHRAAAPCGPGG